MVWKLLVPSLRPDGKGVILWRDSEGIIHNTQEAIIYPYLLTKFPHATDSRSSIQRATFDFPHTAD